MARAREDHPTPAIAKRGRIFPWELWLDGRTWELHRGEDFMSTPEDMEKMIRSYAAQNHMDVRVESENDVLTVKRIH